MIAHSRLTLIAALLVATGNAPDAAGPCDQSDPHLPSPDLYCIQLTAAPGIAATGSVELRYPPGAFTTAVTRDGRQIYQPAVTLRDLPAPGTLGPYTRYVAWVTTPVMSPMVKLGVVGNGNWKLPQVWFDQFVIIVSAERSDTVTERRGRLVLRGGSPSTRLQPPDFQQFALGVVPPGDSAMAQHQHAGDNPGGAPTWTSVPMPPGIGMLPAEMALRPAELPFLPAADATAPSAGRSQLVRLQNHDTLTLIAGRVRRQIHGREYLMYGFNGQVPGPLLWVPRGAEIVVRFENHLDVPSTVHWHGVRLDARFDGVPGVSQEAVPPGGRFQYVVKFPDAGLYWYHPHVREDVQQDLGLSGNIMVRGGESLPPVHREEILLLDDLLIGDGGLVPYGTEHATHALMGRFGNVMQINGEPLWQGRARPGEVVRFWFTNAANARTWNLSIPGTRLRLMAADQGPFDSTSWVESVVIAPAERYAVDVRFDRAGQFRLVNRVRALDHLYGRFIQEADTLGTITVAGTPLRDRTSREFGRPFVVNEASAEIAAAVLGAESLPTRVLEFGLRTEKLPFLTQRLMTLDSSYFHPVEWSGTMVGMNWATTGAQAHWFVRDPVSGAENHDFHWHFKLGERVRLRLVNQRNSLHAMHHPIHLHGQRFVVLTVNGVAPAVRAWKDTVLLPAGSVVDILVEFSNPGQWMLHCHIAEHMESGMMTTFDVEP